MRDRSRRPAAHLRVACGAVKVSVVATLIAMTFGVGAGADTGAQADDADHAVSDMLSAVRPPSRVERVLERHHCSTTGFSGDQQPRSAVVRSARGVLRFVDFDTGWRVYTRHGAAILVAVCLDEAPTRAS